MEAPGVYEFMKTVIHQDHPVGTAIGLNSQLNGRCAWGNGAIPVWKAQSASGNRPAGALPILPKWQ
jgi:hypothetical protein